MNSKSTPFHRLFRSSRPNVLRLYTLVIYKTFNGQECLSLAGISSLCVDKAGSLPLGGATEGCLTQVGYRLTHKHRNKLERLTKGPTP